MSPGWQEDSIHCTTTKSVGGTKKKKREISFSDFHYQVSKHGFLLSVFFAVHFESLDCYISQLYGKFPPPTEEIYRCFFDCYLYIKFLSPSNFGSNQIGLGIFHLLSFLLLICIFQHFCEIGAMFVTEFHVTHGEGPVFFSFNPSNTSIKYSENK